MRTFNASCCSHVPEDLVGLQHLVEAELVGHELLGRKLVLGHELQQHPDRVGVHEPHRDVDVLDPSSLSFSSTGLPCTPSWRRSHRVARSRGHGEGAGKADGFDGDVDPEPIRVAHDLVPPVRVARVDGVGAPKSRARFRRASSRSMAMTFEGPYSREVMTAASPTGPEPTTATTSPGLTRPYCTPISNPVGRMSESRIPSASLMPSGTLYTEFSANGTRTYSAWAPSIM